MPQIYIVIYHHTVNRSMARSDLLLKDKYYNISPGTSNDHF